MSKIPGVRPPSLPSLVRMQDRMTFLYAEHCVVNRADNAVTITDSRGTVHVPAAALSVLMLGPGSNITYAAICLLAESRSTCIWVGGRPVWDGVEDFFPFHLHMGRREGSAILLSRSVARPILTFAGSTGETGIV